MKFSVQVIVHPDDDTERLARGPGGIRRSTATTWLRTPSACSSPRRRTCWRRCRTPWPDSRPAPRSPSRWPARTADGARRHKDTRTIVVRSLFGALRLRQSPLVALRLPRPAHPDLPAAGRAAAGADHPGAALLGEHLRRAHFLRHGRPGACSARGLPAGPDSGGQRHPGHHTQRIPPSAWRTSSARNRSVSSAPAPADWEETTPPGSAAGRRIGRRVCALQLADFSPGWLVRGDRRQVRARRGPAHLFAYVQTHDTKPKRRLFEVLKAHGMQDNQQVTFLTDGGEHPRPPPLPQPAGRAPAGLVPHHHAVHRDDRMTKSLDHGPPDPEFPDAAAGRPRPARSPRSCSG